MSQKASLIWVLWQLQIGAICKRHEASHIITNFPSLSKLSDMPKIIWTQKKKEKEKAENVAHFLFSLTLHNGIFPFQLKIYDTIMVGLSLLFPQGKHLFCNTCKTKMLKRIFFLYALGKLQAIMHKKCCVTRSWKQEVRSRSFYYLKKNTSIFLKTIPSSHAYWTC